MAGWRGDAQRDGATTGAKLGATRKGTSVARLERDLEGHGRVQREGGSA